MTATIKSLQIGLPQDHPADQHGKAWHSAFIKSPVNYPVELTPTGPVGDGQSDLENHGGSDKAVNGYPLAHYHHRQSEFPNLTFPPGATSDLTCDGHTGATFTGTFVASQ